MAGLNKFLAYSIRSSSILEVTVATILMVSVFSIALLTYLNVVSSSPQLRKLKYEAYVIQVAEESVNNKTFVNSEWKDGGVDIYKNIETYKGNSKLILINIKAKDGLGKIIAECNLLTYAAM
jgi:hypothetical protein